ncbi:MAG: hypothetical protein ACO25G_01045 [Holophagaceae bacterium]|jgi:nitrogen fixation-related uncharacterized protein
MSMSPQDEKKMIVIALSVLLLSLIAAALYWAQIFKSLLKNQ